MTHAICRSSLRCNEESRIQRLRSWKKAILLTEWKHLYVLFSVCVCVRGFFKRVIFTGTKLEYLSFLGVRSVYSVYMCEWTLTFLGKKFIFIYLTIKMPPFLSRLGGVRKNKNKMRNSCNFFYFLPQKCAFFTFTRISTV